MKIILTKTSHKEHRIEIVRDDGSKIESSLETKSYLRHDLVHYVVEKNAGLNNSFYGLVRQGHDLGSLREPGSNLGDEIMNTEIIVGILQGAARDNKDAEDIIGSVKAMMKLQNHEVPAYLNEDFYNEVKKEFYVIFNSWDALKTGSSLELNF